MEKEENSAYFPFSISFFFKKLDFKKIFWGIKQAFTHPA
jgi:hypothetical protein